MSSEISTAELADLGIDGVVSDNHQPAFHDGKPGDPPDTDTPDPTPTPAPPAALAATIPPNPLDDAIAVITKPARKPRDYSGIPDEDRPLFEKMANESFAKIAPIYREYLANKDKFTKLPDLEKELTELRERTAKPPRYFDHEQSYLLDQSYREGLAARAQTERVRTFWSKQLENIEAGQPFHTLSQDAQGQYVVSAPIETASPQHKAFILQQIMQANQEYAGHEAKLQQIINDTKSTYSNYQSSLEQAFNTMFGKHLDALKPHAEKNMEILPPQFRNSREGQLAVYAVTALQLLTQQMKAQQQQQTVTAANNRASKIVGPTAEDFEAPVPPPANNAYDPKLEKLLKAEFGI